MESSTYRMLVGVLALLLSFVGLSSAAGADYCMGKPQMNSTYHMKTMVQPALKLWEGIIIILCFGIFAFLMAAIHRIVRSFIYHDGHLVDVYFDAGANVNFAIIASAVVSQWGWTTTYTWSSQGMYMFGISGGYWHAAALAAPIFLFSIIATEIRIKAPGAKTFLQVLHSRFGPVTHCVVMIFAIFTNIMICGILMMESSKLISALTEGFSKEVSAVAITLAVGVYTLVGGAGGIMYMGYFTCMVVVVIMLTFFVDMFVNPLNRMVHNITGAEMLYNSSMCMMGPEDNDYQSLLTFSSRGGMMEGIVLALSSLASVFANQGFWNTAIAANPKHAVWGFLTGGLAYFGIPLMFSFTFGVAYWHFSSMMGYHMLRDDQVMNGYLAPLAAEKLMADTGGYLMHALTLAVILSSAAHQVLSLGSIVVYDIYQGYISPFNPSQLAVDKSQPSNVRSKLLSEEFLEYNRRNMIVKHVVIIVAAIMLFPLQLIFQAIHVDLGWHFKFIGVVVSPCVVPIVLAIAWHRTTGIGINIGVLIGFLAAIAAWLGYASTYPDGLTKFWWNTSQPDVFIVGIGVGLGVAALLCLFISLGCGGCDPNRHEEEEWEKCRELDNPVVPWAMRYATYFCNLNRSTGLPHYYMIRKALRTSEITAYVAGILLTVIFVLVIPALMLLVGVFSMNAFYGWKIAIFIAGCFVALFIVILPFFIEIAQHCAQANNNRSWMEMDAGEGTVVHDDFVVQPATTMAKRNPDITLMASTQQGVSTTRTIGQQNIAFNEGTTMDNNKWKTYIRLD